MMESNKKNTNSQETDRFLSMGEAALYLGISKQTLYAKARSGAIRCYVPSDGHVKQRRKFRKSDLDEYMVVHS